MKNSTSISCIRLHYGFQSTGAHFIDFNSIKLEPGKRPEDLFQRLQSFVEDNLLCSDGFIRHYGELPAGDEEISPSLETFIVLTWLRLIHKDLPGLVKQRYGTELRSQTLASIKPEISQALPVDSLLEEITSASEAKVLRTAFNLPLVLNLQNLLCSHVILSILYALCVNKQSVLTFIIFSVNASSCRQKIRPI